MNQLREECCDDLDSSRIPHMLPDPPYTARAENCARIAETQEQRLRAAEMRAVRSVGGGRRAGALRYPNDLRKYFRAVELNIEEVWKRKREAEMSEVAAPSP